MADNLPIREMALPIGSLDAYISRVHAMPMLTLEEEQDLATRLQEKGDLEAAKRLVMSHLRFVVRMARGYSGYGLQQADLIQEGNIGLMKAVKRFDPKVGVRLVSFAVHWVKAEMHEFILRNWRIVKVATTKAQRKLFFNLRKSSKRLGWFNNEEVTDIANMLNVSPEEVRRMESRLSARDESFDGPVGMTDDSESWGAPVHFLADNSADPSRMLESEDWSDQRQHALYGALENLDERSRDILQARWLAEKKATLHDLAARYSVSAERIRQIESQAMKKLKEAMA